MKTLLVLSAFFVFLSSFCFGQKDEWKEFVSEESKFAINFPVEPEVSKEKMPDGGNRYVFNVNQPERALTVKVSDLPKTSGPMNETALGIFYIYAINGGLDGLKGSKLIKESDIRLNGLLGREYSIANDETFIIRRVFMTEDRLYQISVAVPKTKGKKTSTAETSAKFFSSFRLM